MRRLLDHLLPLWTCRVWDWRPIAAPGERRLEVVGELVVHARTRRAAERRALRRITDCWGLPEPHRIYASRIGR